MGDTIADYQSYATQVGNYYGMPPGLLNWQIGQESSWNPNAQNGNASGIAQFMPGTASQYGLTNPYDPYASIATAGQYMSDLFKKTGSWLSALNSYGTTANNPKATQQAMNVLGQSSTGASQFGATGSWDAQSSSCSALDFGCWYNLLAPRLTAIVLGLIFVLGAFFLWKNN